MADSNLAELKAILEVLLVASLLELIRNGNLIIESDLKVAISWVLDDTEKVRKHNFIINEIWAKLSDFNSISFGHTLRGGNSLADALAKMGVGCSSHPLLFF